MHKISLNFFTIRTRHIPGSGTPFHFQSFPRTLAHTGSIHLHHSLSSSLPLSCTNTAKLIVLNMAPTTRHSTSRSTSRSTPLATPAMGRPRTSKRTAQNVQVTLSPAINPHPTQQSSGSVTDKVGKKLRNLNSKMTYHIDLADRIQNKCSQ